MMICLFRLLNLPVVDAGYPLGEQLDPLPIFKGFEEICRERLPLQYYAGVGVTWILIAVVLDYLFIVLLFKATTYYAPDVFLYYAIIFLIPVGVGWYLNRAGQVAQPG